jgi:hypothetical protein
MHGEFWALTLALVALVILMVARGRERLAGARAARGPLHPGLSPSPSSSGCFHASWD